MKLNKFYLSVTFVLSLLLGSCSSDNSISLRDQEVALYNKEASNSTRAVNPVERSVTLNRKYSDTNVSINNGVLLPDDVYFIVVKRVLTHQAHQIDDDYVVEYDGYGEEIPKSWYEAKYYLYEVGSNNTETINSYESGDLKEERGLWLDEYQEPRDYTEYDADYYDGKSYDWVYSEFKFYQYIVYLVAPKDKYTVKSFSVDGKSSDLRYLNHIDQAERRSDFLKEYKGKDLWGYTLFADNYKKPNTQISFLLTNKDGSPITRYYTVSKESSEHGSITLSQEGKVKANTKIVVTAKADYDYKLDSIYVNGKAITGNSFIVSSNSVVRASFSYHHISRKCNVLLSKVENGMAHLSNDGLLESGTIVEVQVRPDKGYELDKILVNNHPISGNKFRVSKHSIVKVLFNKIK